MVNKILLALIASGLWANVVADIVRPATAQSFDLGQISMNTARTARLLQTLVQGGSGCENRKICD